MCLWLTSLTWPQFDGLNSKSTFYMSFMFTWLEWFQIISLSAIFNHWHLLDDNLFHILSCMTLTGEEHCMSDLSCELDLLRPVLMVDTRKVYRVSSELHILRNNTWRMWDGDILQPNINNRTHFKVFPSWENNIILPVTCLTGCLRADRNTFRDLHRVCVFWCETDLSFLHQWCAVVLVQVWRICFKIPHGRHIHGLIQTHNCISSEYVCQSQTITLQLLSTSTLLCIFPQFLPIQFFLFTIHFDHFNCPSPKSPPVLCVYNHIREPIKQKWGQ